MFPSFHLFRSAACDEVAKKPRLIRWHFAYVSCKVSANVDLVAEARIHARGRKDRHPTDFDDPSIEKNVIADPHPSIDATNGLGRDGDHRGPHSPHSVPLLGRVDDFTPQRPNETSLRHYLARL